MPTLHWLNDDQARKALEKVPYRMLRPDDARSCGDPGAENMLVHGDNLDALKALMPYVAGRVKCVSIDPPYNTGSAFEHYDDNIEHATWLSLMYPRLELLRDLLAEDGSIWVSIDDNEAHYLRVVMDEVFGRKNFLGTVTGGRNQPRLKRLLKDNAEGVVPITLWLSDEVGHNQEAKAENAKLLADTDQLFSTPKPERLIQRVLQIATNPGDLVLDSFLGSGTTAAVAHKMGRRWIGIEMGEHAVTHCAPRLRKVVEGEPGGISKAVGWQGGGGFRFYRLGEPVFDAYGVIYPEVTFEALAAHVWFSETGTPARRGVRKSPLLGVHNGTAYYLLYNGILGDKRTAGGNVLNSAVYAGLPPFDGPKVIYGEWCQWGAGRLGREQVTFKQTPYDIRVR